jgi:hypothetical protein
MAVVAVPAAEGSVIVACLYNQPDGLAWVTLRDNQPLAWMVDQNNPTGIPIPVIIGTLLPAPNTAPIISPPWVQVFSNGQAIVPDLFRGTLAEMFTWIATNNGATRQIYGDFAATTVAIAWNQWAQNNPALALTDPPSVAPAGEAEPLPPLLPARGQHRAQTAHKGDTAH